MPPPAICLEISPNTPWVPSRLMSWISKNGCCCHGNLVDSFPNPGKPGFEDTDEYDTAWTCIRTYSHRVSHMRKYPEKKDKSNTAYICCWEEFSRKTYNFTSNLIVEAYNSAWSWIVHFLMEVLDPYWDNFGMCV